ncbi:hypothetical protein LTR36_007477 [Oleoguttula mirabilis]|uniref:Uncharacterized protein n=1 Tax=Oleoguttula mirabilis TaxID=1507867 RepID=A0AAV9J9V1_9PEZI|nr:hypothetical protein LTR36_007477 [Oleoguttula mirabilis]
MFAEMQLNEMDLFAIALAIFLAVLIALAWIAAPTFEGHFFPLNPFADDMTPPCTAAPTSIDVPEMDNAQQQPQLSFSGMIEHISLAPTCPDGILPGNTAAQSGGDEPSDGDGDKAEKLTECEEAVKALQQEFDTLRVTADETKLKLAESERANTALQSAHNELQSAGLKIQQKLTAGEAARATLEQRVLAANARASAREKDVLGKWHEAQKENVDVPQLRKKTKDAQRREKDAHVKAHNAEAEADEAHQTLALAQARINQLELKVDRQIDEIQRLQRDHDNAFTTAGKLEGEVKQLKIGQKAAYDQHLVAAQVAEQEQKQAQEEIEKLTKELRATKGDHLVSPLQLKRLKKELATANERIEGLEQKLSVKKEGERLREGKRVREADFKIRIKALERENAELRRRLDLLNAKVGGSEDGPPPSDGDQNDSNDRKDPQAPQHDPSADDAPQEESTGGNSSDTTPTTGEPTAHDSTEPKVPQQSASADDTPSPETVSENGAVTTPTTSGTAADDGIDPKVPQQSPSADNTPPQETMGGNGTATTPAPGGTAADDAVAEPPKPRPSKEDRLEAMIAGSNVISKGSKPASSKGGLFQSGGKSALRPSGGRGQNTAPGGRAGPRLGSGASGPLIGPTAAAPPPPQPTLPPTKICANGHSYFEGGSCALCVPDPKSDEDI